MSTRPQLTAAFAPLISLFFFAGSARGQDSGVRPHQDTNRPGILRLNAESLLISPGWPAAWELDGDDFFSPCLMEAELMRRVLPPDEFPEWFHRFIPGLGGGEPASLLMPADVADRSDPKIVHLDGLNLSRAWCMLGIARALPENDPLRSVLIESAVRHAEATLPHLASGNHEGEHWLASFAVYLLSQ